MRKIVLSVFILFITTTMFAQNKKNSVEGAITGFFNGLSLINPDTLNYYTTSYFHLLEGGEVWNMDTLVSKIMPRKNLNIQRINSFDFLRLEQSGKMAWISYFNTAEFISGDQKRTVKWLESAVLVQDNGRWKIQMLHSTPVQ